MKNYRKKFKIRDIIFEHIIENKKGYLIILVLFLIGIFLGVLFINNSSEEQLENINNYIKSFVDKFNSIQDLNSGILLKDSIIQIGIFAISIWFLGTTLIRYSNCIWSYYI